MESNQNPKPVDQTDMNDTDNSSPDQPVDQTNPLVNSHPSPSTDDSNPASPTGSLNTPSLSKNHKTALLLVAVVLLITLVVVGFLDIKKNKPATTIPSTSNTVVLPPAEINITSSGFVPSTVSIKVNQ